MPNFIQIHLVLFEPIRYKNILAYKSFLFIMLIVYLAYYRYVNMGSFHQPPRYDRNKKINYMLVQNVLTFLSR